jgi:hypothetical protein
MYIPIMTKCGIIGYGIATTNDIMKNNITNVPFEIYQTNGHMSCVYVILYLDINFNDLLPLFVPYCLFSVIKCSI